MKYLLIAVFFSTSLQAQLVGDTENGLASYYSQEYDGAETAYGLSYDRNAMVAAHKTYPVNSMVDVRNMENGKSVRVRVIDKGPFIRGRVIEVSERAADLLGLLGKVTIPVEVKLVSIGSPDAPVRQAIRTTDPPPMAERPVVVVSRDDAAAPPPSPPARREAVVKPGVASPATARPTPKATDPNPPKPASTAAPTAKTVARVEAPVEPKIVKEPSLPAPAGEMQMADAFEPGIYKINLGKKPAGNFGVQIGSYRDLEGAIDKVTELQSQWFKDILLERVKVTEGSIYKVLLGPFATRDAAARYTESLKSRYKLNGFVVELAE